METSRMDFFLSLRPPLKTGGSRAVTTFFFFFLKDGGKGESEKMKGVSKHPARHNTSIILVLLLTLFGSDSYICTYKLTAQRRGFETEMSITFFFFWKKGQKKKKKRKKWLGE